MEKGKVCFIKHGESSNEDETEYKPGGYHRCVVGDVLNKRYSIIKQLGWGYFSTVWLSWDGKKEIFVAIKIVKSAENYTKAALDEIKIHKFVSERGKEVDFVIRILDSFQHKGENGTHVCIVMEVMGHNILRVTRTFNNNKIPVMFVKKIVYGTLNGLCFLNKKCGLIHTDIKPENILLKANKKNVLEMAKNSLESNLKNKQEKSDKKYTYDDMNVSISDFGNACWVDYKLTRNIQTRQYRCPEVILEADYDERCDVWSVGCLTFELLTGSYLFDPIERGSYLKDEDHIAKIMEVTGQSMNGLSYGEKYSKFFDRKGMLVKKRRLWPCSVNNLLKKKYLLAPDEAKEAAEFICSLLEVNPQRRPTAEQCLELGWLKCF